MVFEQTKDLRDQALEGFRAMADMSFDCGWKLAERLMKFLNKKQWVIAKPLIAVEFSQNSAAATPFGRESYCAVRIR